MDNITIGNILYYTKDYSETDRELILKAYQYAKDKHENQFRESGEAYIVHPLNVAFILASLKQDANTICAGFLHDTLEDTNTTIEDLKYEFNSDIATLVDGVTKIPESDDASSRKLLTAGLLVDLRIIIIKLADRLHNMRTLEFKSKAKQKEKAIETMKFYTPIAYYTGAYNIKSDLEDLSFKFLKPDTYKQIEEQRLEFELNSAELIEEVLENLTCVLQAENLNPELVFNTKNVYRIYLSKKSHNTDSLYELPSMLVLRVILEEVMDCYKTLGLIHREYTPVNSKFKDYICNPKINGYKSIQTTLNIGDDRLLQAHIRTKEMDRVADYGLFSEKQEQMNKDIKDQYIFRTINELNSLYTDNSEFLSSVFNEVLGEVIHVETIGGDIVELPKGSTVIDFAYKIHTDVGNEMVGALVNGKIVEPSHRLKDKDKVRVIRDKESAEPQEEWIDYAKTTHAREKIKKYIKKNRI